MSFNEHTQEILKSENELTEQLMGIREKVDEIKEQCNMQVNRKVVLIFQLKNKF